MPVALQGQDTRERILNAAAALFARHGYEAAGVAEICQAAEVSKGAFYHHFPSKQALFLELLARWLGELEQHLVALSEIGGTVPEKLMAMTAAAARVFEAARGQLPIFLEFWNQAIRDPAIWQATVAPYRRFHALFSRLIRAGVEEGSIRPVNAELVARALLSLAMGYVLQGVLDPEGADWGQALADGVALLLRSLEPPVELGG
jgi:AcrR family transcriptional regulator